jgi:hypothetical protein
MNACVNGLGEVFPLLQNSFHIRQYEFRKAHRISFDGAIQASYGDANEKQQMDAEKSTAA